MSSSPQAGLRFPCGGQSESHPGWAKPPSTFLYYQSRPSAHQWCGVPFEAAQSDLDAGASGETPGLTWSFPFCFLTLIRRCQSPVNSGRDRQG